MADKVGKAWGKLGGASGRMHSFTPTGTQKPGGSSQEPSGGSRRDIKVKAGSSSVMGFSESGNKSFAGTQTPGQSAAQPTGGDNKFAKGGTTKMFGNSGSQRQEGGRTSAR